MNDLSLIPYNSVKLIINKTLKIFVAITKYRKLSSQQRHYANFRKNSHWKNDYT